MTKRKISILCFALMMILWCLAGTFTFVSAEETTGSMTLWCVKDEDVVANMHWQLYRVGHREADDYVFEGDFAGCRTTLGDQTKSMLEWDAETVASVAESLKRLTIADDIEKREEGFTNASGAVTFTGLEDGLYLIWGDILQVGDTIYVPSAIFFEMNGQNANVLNAYPKIVLRTLSDTMIVYSARKVWENDDDQLWNRAVSITVERYRDNEYYDEFVLSEDNNWTYEWEDAEAHTWFVYEKDIPENYTVSYKENQTQYLIINTFEDDSQISSTTTATTETSTTTTTETTVTTTTEDSSTTSTSQSQSQTTTSKTTTTQTVETTTTVTTDKIPQTGQLWWPVPGLAAGGLVMLGLGVVLCKKDDEE